MPLVDRINWAKLLCPILVLLLGTIIGCHPSEQTGGISGQGAPQSRHALSINTVSAATHINVYELDQRRGVIAITPHTIAPGTRLVTLAWGAWSIIATDPLRLVLSTELSSSQGQCPLSVYPLDQFLYVPGFDVVGERLSYQNDSTTPVRPLILGKGFSVADADSGLVAKSTAALWPHYDAPVATPGWMPAGAQIWLNELNIPTNSLDPLVNDNAFLDFAACYLIDQPALVTFLEKAHGEPMELITLPNGQHVVVSNRGMPVRGSYKTYDEAMYVIDRDVLHFGIVAPARYIPHPVASYSSPVSLLITKHVLGLEEQMLMKHSEAYRASSEFDRDQLIMQSVQGLAATETGYKAAIFELLFNEYDRYGLHNQILTAAGGVVMFDHEYPDRYQSPIPCYQRMYGFRNDHPELSALYDNDYAAFEHEFRNRLQIPIRVHSDGTVFDATQFYIQILEAGTDLPRAVREKLRWVLEHRAETEPVLRRLFHQINNLKAIHHILATNIEETSVCVFYERIAWLVANQRLPNEAEGMAIMNTCGTTPGYSCRL